MSEHFLNAENISFQYSPESVVLQNVSFSVERGEILTIIGPNGAGKSTLLNCICGLLSNYSGSVLIDGKNIRHIPPRKLAKHIAYVSQNQNRVYDYTVREYVAMGRAPYIGYAQSPSRADYELVDAALEKMGLEHLAYKFYTQISGGECQRAMIARAMVQQADLIIFDEPTNHLDYGNQIKVLRQIQDLSRDGFSVIWTTHTPDHALMIDGKVAILNHEGHLVTGISTDLLSQERLTELYQARICRTFVEDADREACIPYRL